MGAEAILNYTLLYQKTAKFTSEARIYETFKNGEDVRWENKLFSKQVLGLQQSLDIQCILKIQDCQDTIGLMI